MAFLYGDATPFPLDENFIDTLVALTKTCVELFKVHNAEEVRKQQSRDAQSKADAELARLRKLKASLDEALAAYQAGTQPDAADRAAAHIATAVQNAIQNATDTVSQTRDGTIRTSLSVNVAEQIRTALGSFAAKHQLPETTWGLNWRFAINEERAEARIKGVTARGVQLLFTAAIPTDSEWSHPLKVSEIRPDLQVTVSKESGLIGKSLKPKTESLQKMVITEINATPGQQYVVVRQSAKKQSPGFKLLVRDAKKPAPAVIKIDGEGLEDGPAERLKGPEGGAIKDFFSTLEKKMQGLVAMRRGLSSIKVGKDTSECDKAADLAEFLLEGVAPIVLEIRKRSKVKGELTLKRELGGGRREELFVDRGVLRELYGALPDGQRRVFEAIGLGAESTEEFATRGVEHVTPHNEITMEADYADD